MLLQTADGSLGDPGPVRVQRQHQAQFRKPGIDLLKIRPQERFSPCEQKICHPRVHSLPPQSEPLLRRQLRSLG